MPDAWTRSRLAAWDCDVSTSRHSAAHGAQETLASGLWFRAIPGWLQVRRSSADYMATLIQFPWPSTPRARPVVNASSLTPSEPFMR